mgnify:CR=1 FL=1|jgi:hypothetical protein
MMLVVTIRGMLLALQSHGAQLLGVLLLGKLSAHLEREHSRLNCGNAALIWCHVGCNDRAAGALPPWAQQLQANAIPVLWLRLRYANRGARACLPATSLVQAVRG